MCRGRRTLKQLSFARAALLVVSLYEIHERHHLDSAGNTNGIAARDFVTCVLRFAITRETE